MWRWVICIDNPALFGTVRIRQREREHPTLTYTHSYSQTLTSCMLSASQQQLVVHNCRLVSNYADSTPPAKINEYFRKSTKNSSTCAGQQLNKRKAPHFSCSTYRAFSLSLSYTNKHSHTHTHTLDINNTLSIASLYVLLRATRTQKN